jgi:hypothetical protein
MKGTHPFIFAKGCVPNTNMNGCVPFIFYSGAGPSIGFGGSVTGAAASRATPAS